MHRIYLVLIAICHTTVFSFTLPATIESHADQYDGTITTLDDHEYAITDMFIGGKQSCIPVYKAPADKNKIIPTLSYDPRAYMSQVNLADIREIHIPYPYAQWVYKGKGKKKYLLVTVIWHSEQQPESNFLIEPKRRLSGTVTKKRSTHRKIPFSGLKKISIAHTQN